MAQAKRYGSKNGRAVPLADYHQSKDNAAEYPPTTTEKVITTNLPNIFSYRSHVFAKKPELVQRFVKATKADVGGVGGHVVAAEEVKGVITKFVLDNNSYQGEPMFTSLIVTHTGDDVAVTGITTEKVPNEVIDEVMWDALNEGAAKAAELGLYGPGQDLIADAFTGNLRGAGPASVVLPLPVRPENPSQTVVVSFADKTEPMAFNYFATGAYLNPRFNSGLVIASSRMKRGYLFEIVDLDTKAQAVEAGAHPRDQKALDGKMEELAKGLQERVITLRAPEDLFDIEGLTRSSRFVVARIWSRDDKDEASQLGYVVSAERLHNIKTKKGFTYGGKDDPVLLAFAQGDWPAPGELSSPWATCPMVAGRLPREPQPPHPAGAAQLADVVLVGADPLLRDALDQHQHGPHRRHLRPVRPRHAVGLGPHARVRAGGAVPQRARRAPAGHAARGRARVPGRVEGAAPAPRRPLRRQAAARVERQRQAPQSRVDQGTRAFLNRPTTATTDARARRASLAGHAAALGDAAASGRLV